MTLTVPGSPAFSFTSLSKSTTGSCQTQAAVNTAFTNWLATASSSGGCDGSRSNNNTGAPDKCGGSTTVTFTYTSSCAPTITTCAATFTVSAPPAVSLTCPVNATTGSCQTQAAVNTAFTNWLATASSSGGCDGSRSNNHGSGTDKCGGSATVTFTYTSSCAPTITTCAATFTVTGPPAVSLTCPTNATTGSCQTQAAVNTAFTNWLATASSSGGCNGTRSDNHGAAPDRCGGSATVTFTYTSSCAPTITTCAATFTVSAPPAVSLTCPTNTTVAAGRTQTQVDAAFAAWLATASSSGGCDGSPSDNHGAAPGNCGGSVTVTFTDTSSCSPTATTCSAIFAVSGTAGAQVSCPANTTTTSCQTQAQVNTAFTTWLGTASGTGGTVTNNG